jgi:hypothetical protein
MTLRHHRKQLIFSIWIFIFDADLTILPVLNKIDLPGCQIEAVEKQMKNVFDIGKVYLIQHYVSQWFSPGTPVSFTNKTYRHDITEILLKVAFQIEAVEKQMKNVFDMNPEDILKVIIW